MRSLLAILLAGAACAAPIETDRRSVPASANDWNELHYAAQLSSAAYSACQGTAFGVQIASQINNAATNTQGFIGYNPSKNRIVTAFRGSTAPQDFLNDLDILPVVPKLSGVAFPSGVYVMNGIVSPYSSVHSQVISTIKSLLAQHPTAALEVTGHSLGGSLTYLAHVAVAQNFPNQALVSNALAAFPIGNSAFASFASSQRNAMLRRGNELGDGVPNMYPQFTHYGTEFYGPGIESLERQCSGERDLTCSAGDGAFTVTPAHVTNSGVVMALDGCG